jgi:hypothetical protein
MAKPVDSAVAAQEAASDQEAAAAEGAVE